MRYQLICTHKLVVETAGKIEVTKSVSMENNIITETTDEFFELDCSDSPETLQSSNKRKFEIDFVVRRVSKYGLETNRSISCYTRTIFKI